MAREEEKQKEQEGKAAAEHEVAEHSQKIADIDKETADKSDEEGKKD